MAALTSWMTRETSARDGVVNYVKSDPDMTQEQYEEWWAALTPYLRRCAMLAKDPTIQPHGKTNTYLNYGCRCGECVDARKSDSRRRPGTSTPAAQPATGTHGREGYLGGCKCTLCLDGQYWWLKAQGFKPIVRACDTDADDLL